MAPHAPQEREGDRWKEKADVAMDRYACGDDSAFSTLYELLAPRLHAFLVRRTRDEARAQDLVQQTFLQMHCARRHFASGAAVMPWSFAIARRLLIDAFRKDVRLTFGAEEDARDRVDEKELPDGLVGKRRLVGRVREALARVPEHQLAAFELVHGDGLTTAEAAEVLGTTPGAVKLRVHRVYVYLRVQLGDELRDELGETYPLIVRTPH
jgi:RNA polymerase sigma-70 factor, ECF subfamily